MVDTLINSQLESESVQHLKVKSTKRKKVGDAETPNKSKVQRTQHPQTKKSETVSKPGKNGKEIISKNARPKVPFNVKNKNIMEGKVEDWNKFKKEKKELKIKRVKAKAKDNFGRIQEAKKLGERVRVKILKEHERTKIINQLHELLQGHYAKFVLAHDTARIVQWLLKYSSKALIHQISQELIPVTVSLLQSKYGIYCVKRLLKYGEDDVRNSVINQMNGYAVKLASHAISAPVLELAFSSYATPAQKQFLVQEFYGTLYTSDKDPDVKHIKDVYKHSKTLKAATLGACKANIKKVLNKSLLDSGLVQTILSQYLEECSADDRAEIIAELAPHIVIISNSRDGSKAAMQCIWHGTAKDKKVIMKSLKEHLKDLCKHEFGHRTIIAVLDSVDDTVLLHKIVLSEILKNAKDLAANEWGRKVLLWLVAPADSTIFHPRFIKEFTEGREKANSKKSAETRRQEILAYSVETLLNLIIDDTKFWLSTGSLAIEMLAIIKAGSGSVLKEALSKIVETIVDTDWKIKSGENEVLGIENPGVHMTLKKMAQHDKQASILGKATFGSSLLQKLTHEVVSHWLTINRGCFLLVAVLENSDEDIHKKLKKILKPHLKLLKAQKTPGAKILLKYM